MNQHLAILAAADPRYAAMLDNNTRAGDDVCEFIASLSDDVLARIIILAPTQDFSEPFMIHSVDCKRCTNKIGDACDKYQEQHPEVPWPAEKMEQLYQRIAESLGKTRHPVGRLGGPRRYSTS